MTSRQPSSAYLYRILSFDRLVQMLRTDEWFFAHPSSWPDPFERRTRNALYSSLFAQCWCRNGVSDAMWRIYSPLGLGVRIRTRAVSLELALTQASLESPIGTKVKKVRYVTEREYRILMAETEKKLAEKVTFTRASAHLFLKRKAFEHEAETRVIVFDLNQPLDGKAKGVKVKLDTRELIDSVLVDPRAPTEFVEMYSHYLKSVLKYNGTVAKSQLYEENQARET